MRKMKKRAFTLIELLVVIAIIAILAAILFPVFAQAKRAAKGSVAISGAKQMALAQLMYTGDYDDNFAPVIQFNNAWQEFPFSYVQQPYMKNWGILLDPTGPIPVDIGTNDSGYNFSIYGLWGMGPRQAATDGSFSNYTFGTSTTGAAMTNGEVYKYDGIAGVGNYSAGGIWSAYGYKDGSTPSLSTTAVNNPADQVMIAQASNYDFMWQQDNADSFDLYWGWCEANTYGCKLTATAPIARFRDNDGPTVGYYPWPGSLPANAKEPTGMTVWTGTDGHAKASAWRSLMGTTITLGDGSKAIKAFWPNGS
ncbi:MAG: prepilin-type N-terminal cleavage/methylation domain-containing protein [Armatimonadetes bacterium]|nr:prepilin-type N-terminal cleavage/methylation domain-containing protein [Armatimonadota bacterium]